MNAQQFMRSDFDHFVSLVANNAAHRPVGHTYLMTSDVAWQFPGCAPKENIRLWRDHDGVSAYAWFQPPDTVKFDFRSDLGNVKEVLAEILEWTEVRRSQFGPSYPFYIDLNSMDEWAEAVSNPTSRPQTQNNYLVASVLETDEERLKLLNEQGFTATQHFEPILTCDLSAVQIPDPTPTFSLRHVTENEFQARVELHSASWAPASGFNMDQYLRVRGMHEIYDPELDIVAVANDGTFASYTIAWSDPVSRIGSFEPFGTHPAFRGSGVSSAVISEGFRRLKNKGMLHARIYTAGFNHQAARLYQSCGFTQVDVNRTMLKQL